MTEAEKAFLTMAKMADLRGVMTSEAIAQGLTTEAVANRCWDKAIADGHEIMVTAVQAGRYSTLFPIVASTFEALTIERPELREHYDRAKQAWEASQ